jgi:hypothetical protein
MLQRDRMPVRAGERREFDRLVHRLDLAQVETAAGEFAPGSRKVIDR